jgi:branched-chain amino acid transport system permease protein
VVLPWLHFGSPYAIYVATAALVLAVMLLGLCLTLGLTGLVDLGMAAFVGVGAYISARTSMGTSVSPFLTPLVGALAAGLLAYLLGPLMLRVRGHYFAVATLGFCLVGYHLLIQLKQLTNGVDGLGGIPVPRLLGLDFSTELKVGRANLPYQLNNYYWALLGLIACFYLVSRLSTGQFGRCLRALRDNEIAAVGCGADPARYYRWAYSLAALIGGFAGGLYAHTTNYIAPGDFDLGRSITLVGMAVIGDMGAPAACVAVALLMTFLEEALRELGDFRLLMVGAAILAVMLSQARHRRGLAPFGGLG